MNIAESLQSLSIPIGSVIPDPANARVGHDIEGIKNSLLAYGQRTPIVVNKRTGIVLKGNGTLAAAREIGSETIAAVFVDDDPMTATSYAIADNRIGDKSHFDDAALKRLLDSVESPLDIPGIDSEFLAELTEINLDIEKQREADFDDVQDELEGAAKLMPDMLALNSDDLPYNIPRLREDMIYDGPLPTDLWPGDDLGVIADEKIYFLNKATSARLCPFEQSVYGYYTDDSKFESVWQQPEKDASRIINGKFMACVSPNFSLYPDMALAIRVYNAYRSKWISRFYQEAGIKIIPDINFSCIDDLEFSIAGIPKNSTVSIQIQTFDRKDESQVKNIVAGFMQAFHVLEPSRVLVYASKYGRKLAEDSGILSGIEHAFIPSLMDVRREKLDKKKR